MKKIILRFLVSSVISGFAISGNALANTPQSNLISVIANVQLTGAVKKPGIYKVPSGTRLVDVLIKAGGLKKDAVTTNLNLTSPVSDGTVFNISSSKDTEIKPVEKVIILKDSKQEKKLKKTGRRKNDKKQQKTFSQVNLNTATQEELDSLPGIGENLAKVIIKYRTKNGKFKDLAAFNNVPGIGDKKIEKLKNKISL